VQRQGGIFLGILLLGIGGLYLLRALDVWSGDVSIWPGILIVVGFAIGIDEWFKDRRISWFTPLLLIAVGAFFLLRDIDVVDSDLLLPLVLIGVGVVLLAGAARRRGQVSDRIDVPLNGASQARVRIEHGGGELRVGSLPSGDARLALGSAERVTVTHTRSGATLDVSISQARGAWARSIGKQFRVDFSPDVDLELDLRTGATDTKLNLSNLRVRSLRLKTGASSTIVDVPRSGQVAASVDAGAASVEFRIPENVAARITSDVGLAGVKIDTGRFTETAMGYESADYAVAVDRIDLRLKGGVASFAVS
jgi:hypothetical protein